METTTTGAPELVARILDSFKKNSDLDLSSVLHDPDLSGAEKSRKMKELARASLAKKFNINTGDPILAPLTTNDQAISAVPNLLYTNESIDELKKKEGPDIFSFVSSTSNTLLLMSESQSDEQLVSYFVGTGILAIGTPMAISVIKQLRLIGKIGPEAIANAIKTGVKVASRAAVIVAVVALVIETLLFLAFKLKKQFFGIVFNLTSFDLFVKGWEKGGEGEKGFDLFMKHGDMISFMFSDPLDGNPGCAIKGQVAGDGLVGKQIGASAGFFFCEKAAGFFGAEGMAVFTAKEFDTKFAISFACPFSEKNGTNAAIVTSIEDQENFYEKLYDKRALDVYIQKGSFAIQSRVNHEKGGEAAGLAFITELRAVGE